MDTFNKITVLAGVFFSYILAQYTNFPAAIQILLALMAIDMLSGFLISIRDKTLSARTAFIGVTRKCAELALIIMAQIVQPMIGAGIPLASVLAGYYIYVEATSILEHASSTGIPIPDILKSALEKLNTPKEVPKDLTVEP